MSRRAVGIWQGCVWHQNGKDAGRADKLEDSHTQHSGLRKGKDEKRLEKAEPSWEVCYGDLGLGRDLSICKDIA